MTNDRRGDPQSSDVAPPIRLKQLVGVIKPERLTPIFSTTRFVAILLAGSHEAAITPRDDNIHRVGELAKRPPAVATSRIKRAFDVSVASVALLLLFPLLASLAILVRLKLGSPVLFKQTRPGMNGEPFQILKFRTMTNETDAQGELLPDDQRLLRFGKWLRSTSLDELPELINVVLGEMSLVGPRPLIMEYLSRYTPAQARRHLARPGITGLAQVRGRNALAWEERFELDVHYIDNWCFLLDLKILVWTVSAVFKREGISTAGHATAPEFMGSGDDLDPD